MPVRWHLGSWVAMHELMFSITGIVVVTMAASAEFVNSKVLDCHDRRSLIVHDSRLKSGNSYGSGDKDDPQQKDSEQSARHMSRTPEYTDTVAEKTTFRTSSMHRNFLARPELGDKTTTRAKG